MNKDVERPDFDSDEREILSLLKNIHPEEDDPAVPPRATSSIPATEEPAETESSDTQWLLPLAEPLPEEPEEPEKPSGSAAPAEPEPTPRPAGSAAHAASYLSPQQLRRVLHALIPMKGDTRSEIIRKSALLLSLAVFLCSLVLLLYYMVLEPRSVQNNSNRYADLYYDTRDHQSENVYPPGMQAAFRQLYDINPDIAGWLSYQSTDSEKFMQIELPVVHCGDNETYLSRAFDGSKSRSGTLFFDASNTISSSSRNKVSIIYGHNMASGLMFAPLNRLINNVYYARSAPLINMNTLYEDSQYQVFAVLVLDEDAPDGQYFNYLRTSFADDDDFLNYVQQVRARSLYNYPVSVGADDNLLVLSTCTNRSQVKVKNGRLAVFARRVSGGNNGNTDTTLIEKNEDVIMPYAWYTVQGLTPHPYYTGAADTATNESTASTTATDTVGSSALPTTTTEDNDLAARGTKTAVPVASKTASTKTKKTAGANTTGTTTAGTATTGSSTTPTDTATTQTDTVSQEDPA